MSRAHLRRVALSCEVTGLIAAAGRTPPASVAPAGAAREPLGVTLVLGLRSQRPACATLQTSPTRRTSKNLAYGNPRIKVCADAEVRLQPPHGTEGPCPGNILLTRLRSQRDPRQPTAYLRSAAISNGFSVAADLTSTPEPLRPATSSSPGIADCSCQPESTDRLGDHGSVAGGYRRVSRGSRAVPQPCLPPVSRR